MPTLWRRKTFEDIDASYKEHEKARRNFRFWHIFSSWRPCGFLIPWCLWIFAIALMIKGHFEIQEFAGAGNHVLVENPMKYQSGWQSGAGFILVDTPYRDAIFLLTGFALTVCAKHQAWFVTGVILILWAAA